MAAQIKTKAKHLPNELMWPKARARQIDFTVSIVSTAHSEAQNDARGSLLTTKATATTLDSYEAQNHCG